MKRIMMVENNDFLGIMIVRDNKPFFTDSR